MKRKLAANKSGGVVLSVGGQRPSGPGLQVWDRLGRAIGSPNALTMLGLGFGCGLPYLLIGSTLGFWLREMAVPLGIIGFFSWTTLPYALKFLWAKALDDRPPPFVGRRYGQRKGWILLSQAMVLVALLGVMAAGKSHDILLMAAFCLVAGLAGASQDIVVDAFRIESGLVWGNPDTALTAYQLGYRIALLLSDGLIFILAGKVGWPGAYAALALLMVMPVLAGYLAQERKSAILSSENASIGDAVNLNGPESFKGWVFVFLIVAFYRLPDLVINPMINPLYHDMGVGKDVLAGIHIGAGIVASFLGIGVAAASIAKIGLSRSLTLGAILQVAAVCSFAIVAFSGGSVPAAAVAIAADGLAGSFTGVILVSYMSQFITPGRAGLQFATLTCAYALIGKILSGLSGLCVMVIGHWAGHDVAYGAFFLAAAFTGLPAIVLLATKTSHDCVMTGDA